ncbi:MAG: crossover junction endodeoxyribonuclease RuvC [candidate division WOR-3 bacterium]|nr:MAG: crossover junction endodeoxyribonuclease RuvC [candidate division WOR-3 bacterium]
MKVIGIDPGITATGYGIVEDGKNIYTGTIRPRKKETYGKIFEICEHIKSIVETNRPDCAALEKVFYHKNLQSLIRSSELRGAIILTLLSSNIKILEYTPSQIKLTTTGNGRASKRQVRYFIERIITRSNQKHSVHAIDALAIAYTAVKKMQSQTKKSILLSCRNRTLL